MFAKINARRRKVNSFRNRSLFKHFLALEQLESRLAMDATVVGTNEVDHIRVSPGGAPNSVRVSSDNGSFSPRVFTNLSGTLFLQPGGGNDTITIEPLGTRFNGNVIVNDNGYVTLKDISLFGSLTVNGRFITADDGSTIASSNGDILLSAKSESSLTFPLSQIGLKDREDTADISIGSSKITGRNIKLLSDAGAKRVAKVEYNQDARAVALADVNGDLKPDLIVVNSDPGTGGGLGGPLLLFLNTGKSDPFEGSIPVTITRGGAMTSVAIADVNGDSKPDLVVGSTANPNLPGTAIFSRLFLNTGSEDLPFRDVPGRVFNVGTGRDYTNSVALADLNGDSKPDLVLGNGVGLSASNTARPTASRIILNQGGNNPFSEQGTTLGLATANTQAVAIADINRDGRLDIITGNAAYSTGVAPNVIDVLSPSRVFLNAGGASPFSGDGIALVGTGNDAITSLAVGDVNRDNRPDIVLGNNGKPSRLFLSTASIFAHEAPIESLDKSDATKSVSIVDINRDGNADLVLANAGTSRVYMGSQRAMPFTTSVDLGANGSEAQATVAVAAADLNGDNRPDLVLGSKGAPTQIYVHDGSPRPYIDANAKVVSLDPTLTNTVDLPAFDQINVLGSVVKSKATAGVNIASGAVLTASQNVEIGSTALADARNTTVGMMVGFTVGIAEPTATVTLASGATVTAGRAFDFRAKANALLDVSVITLSPALVNIDVAYGKANAVSNATLAQGSRVTARNVNVEATNTNTLSTAAGGYNISLGGPVSGGLGVAISEYNSEAKANVNGRLTTTGGDAFVDARSINVKDSTVGTASVIGTPDLVNFVRGLLKGLSNKLSASAKSASSLKGGSKQGTLSSLLSTSPSDFSSVGLAAGVAVPTTTNLAEAKIGPKAVVTVKGNLRVNSRAEDNFKVIATGDSSGSSVADFGGGVAVATLSNTALSSLEGGSDVQVAGLTRVLSNAVYPNPVNSAIPGFRFVPPPDITNAPGSDANRIENGYQMGQALTDSFMSYITQTVVPVVKGVLLGDPSTVGTSFVKGTGGTEAGGRLGIGGGVNIMNFDNKSTAQIGKGAKVNQRQTGLSNPTQDVWLESNTTIITMNFGNQISALNVASAGAGASGAVGIGGQFEYVDYNNSAKTIIDDGALVSARRDIKATADTLNYLLTVSQAGAKAAKVGVGGTVNFHEIRNQTLAYAEDGAVLNAGRDLQIQAGNQLQVFNAGGGITLGSTTGVGVSLAANFVQQNDTWAFIGNNNGSVAIGSAKAGRNMDVKAIADTLAVGLAISGSAADGLPPVVDQPKGPEAFGSFKEWEQALLKYQISLNPKGGVAVSGDATVNSLVSDTRAFINGSSNVTVGGALTVDANDTSLFAAASGAVAYGNSTGIGGSLAVNSIRRNTLATIDKTPVTAGSLSITANSIETPVTITVGAGIAKENAAVAGSVSITDVVSDVKATLGRSSPVTTNGTSTATVEGGGVTVSANRTANTYSVAGVAAAAISGSASIGLAVDLALQDGEVLASLNSPVVSSGNVRVFAADAQKLFGVAAGLAAAATDGAGIAGSATVDRVNQVAHASIAPSMKVTAAGTVRVDADGLLQNVRVAGSVAGGKKAGVGGAFTINLVPDRSIQATIGSGAQVTGRGNGLAVADPQDSGRSSRGVALDANTVDRLLLFAAAGGISPGTLGVAGSAIGNSLSNNSTQALIDSSAIINQGTGAATQDVTVSANHITTGLSVAGSVAGARTVGVGAAVVTEVIDRDVNAIVERDANVRTVRYLTVDATSSMPLTTVAGAVAGAVDVAGAGSVIVQTLTTDTTAQIKGLVDAGAKTKVDAGAIRVWADNDSEQDAVAGVVAGSGRASIGASNVTNVQTNKTNASVSGESIVTRGATGLTAPSGRRSVNGVLLNVPVRGMAVISTAQEDITSVAAGGTGGKVGLAGSVTVTTLDVSTISSIGQRSTLDTPLSLIAADDTLITGGGGAGGGGLYVGVGAGIDVQTVKKTVSSNVQASTTITPAIAGDVVVRALSTGNQLSISAAIAAGGYTGVAGGASGIRSENRTGALLSQGATVTTKGNVVVTAEDTSTAVGIAGSAGASFAAGVGASVGVAIVSKDTLAQISGSAVVTANPNANSSTKVADGGFAIADQIPVGGLFDPSTDINSQAQTIKLDTLHNFKPGAAQAVKYSADLGAAARGLVNGQTYYVIVVDSQTIKLATTAQQARAGTSDVFPGSAPEIAIHSLTPVGQGPIPFRDSVDPVGNQQIRDILNRRGLAPTERLIQGVAVTAVNLGRIESYAGSAGAGMVAVPISATVDVINSKASAIVNNNAKIAATDVLVSAGNELLHLGVGGAIGVDGGAGVAPGIQVPIATLETRALLGDSVKITAANNVEVKANANEDVLSFAVGLSRGIAAVGGSVGVLTLKSITVAETGANSIIDAGGSVGVESYDTTNTAMIAGSAALGAAAGLGGSVAVVYLDKDTRASLGIDSTVNAKGGGNSNLFSTAIAPLGQTVNGVLVQAVGQQDLYGVVAAGAVGSFGGLAGAVTVATANTRTTAEVGDRAKVNNLPGGVPIQDSVVYALDSTSTRAFAGALAGSGITSLAGGLAGGVDVGLFNPIVVARVGTDAIIKAARDVAVNGDSKTDVQSAAASAAAGNIGVAGAVSVYGLGNSLSEDGQRSLRGNDAGNTATVGGYVDDVAKASQVTELLSKYQSNPNSSEADKRVAQFVTGANSKFQASLPNGRASSAISGNGSGSTSTLIAAGSSLVAGGKAIIAGGDDVKLNQTTGTVAAGAAALGGAVGIVNVGHVVDVIVDGTVAATGNVAILSAYEANLSGGAGAGLGSSNGVTVGLIGIGAQVTRFNDQSSNNAILNGAVTKADTLSVKALRNRIIDANAQGVTVGGVVVGVASAHARAVGSTRATITGQVGQAVGQQVRNLELRGESTSQLYARTRAVATGVVSGAGSDAHVGQNSANTGVRLINAQVKVAEDVTLVGKSRDYSSANADGTNVGGATMGLSQAITEATAMGGVIISGLTVINAGRDLNANAHGETKSDTTASASGGGVLSFGDSTLAQANLNPISELRLDGSGVQLSAGRDISLTSNTFHVDRAIARSDIFGLFGTGMTTAFESRFAKTVLAVHGSVVTAGGNIEMGASSTDGDSDFGGSTMVTAVGSSPTRAAFVPTMLTDIIFDRGARITAGNEKLIRLTAEATMNADVTTDGSLRAIGDARAIAETVQRLVTNISLGDALLDAGAFITRARGRVTVTNIGIARIAGIQTDIALNQADAVTNQARITGAEGGSVKIRFTDWNPIVEARMEADGSTNGAPRTKIDIPDKLEEFDYKGQVTR